jgi:hypothetical protein
MDATCEMYAKNAVLCLRLADYAKPVKYTVEAMVRIQMRMKNQY